MGILSPFSVERTLACTHLHVSPSNLLLIWLCAPSEPASQPFERTNVLRYYLFEKFLCHFRFAAFYYRWIAAITYVLLIESVSCFDFMTVIEDDGKKIKFQISYLIIHLLRLHVACRMFDGCNHISLQHKFYIESAQRFWNVSIYLIVTDCVTNNCHFKSIANDNCQECILFSP